MPAPEYKEELRDLKFPVDANTRPVSVLYTFDPVTEKFGPVTSEGITGVGQVLNTNIVGGVMQVENLHVAMDSTGLRSATDVRINPAKEDGNLLAIKNQTDKLSFTGYQLDTSDTLNDTAVSTALDLTTAPIVARAGANNLLDRKALVLQAKSDNILWGFSVGSQPFSLSNNEKAAFDIGPNIDVYVRMSAGTGTLAVAEIS